MGQGHAPHRLRAPPLGAGLRRLPRSLPRAPASEARERPTLSVHVQTHSLMGPEVTVSTPVRILLQTTIPTTADDWNFGPSSLLRDHRASVRDPGGTALYDVVTRDRAAHGDDAVLSTLDASDISELWLFAVDSGNGLTAAECAAIGRFRRRGGGLLVARDHEDLGSSVCTLGGVGAAHHFHSKNPEPPERRTRDDVLATNISWPNYHSGSNGDLQVITPVGELHPVLLRADGSAIREFPAHPHEGAVSAPADASARVIATGTSTVSGHTFNLIVAFERSAAGEGRALAHASFHHLVDYNWDPARGHPSFVTDPEGDQLRRDPSHLSDVHAYVANAAAWLSAH